MNLFAIALAVVCMTSLVPGFPILCVDHKTHTIVTPKPSPTASPAPTASPTPQPTATPTVAPTPTPTPTAAPTATPTPSYGTIVWKAGDPNLGKWETANTYQCGNPVLTGSTFYFVLSLEGQKCGRNQMLPLTQGGSTFTLTFGRVYTWTFTYIDGDTNDVAPGMGDDQGEAEAVLWQTHGESEPHTPCSQLGWGNTPIGSASGQPQQWLLGDCGHMSLEHPFWTAAYAPQETDSFVIQQLVSTGSDGWTKIWRNGVLVATSSGANVNPNTGSAFWNFGVYKWRWELANGGGSKMTEVQDTVVNMVLYEQ